MLKLIVYFVNNKVVNLAKISNLLARSFIVFIIAYLWLSFYIRDMLMVFIVAFAIMIAFNLLVKVVYKFLPKPKSPPPTYVHEIVPPRQTNYIFTRKKVKTYILFGLIILATSFIVRFNIYYIIFATVLFSFALVSLFMVRSSDDNSSSR